MRAPPVSEPQPDDPMLQARAHPVRAQVRTGTAIGQWLAGTVAVSPAPRCRGSDLETFSRPADSPTVINDASGQPQTPGRSHGCASVGHGGVRSRDT